MAGDNPYRVFSYYSKHCRKRRKKKKHVPVKKIKRKSVSLRKKPKKPKGSATQLSLYRSAKARAKKKGIAFNITPEDIIIPECCPVFGFKFSDDDRWCRPSIDRIDSDLGYLRGNIDVISLKANTLKGNGTISDFEQIIKYIKKHK